METFQIKNLTFTYPSAQKAALKEINLRVDEGEFVVICGRSGCGKSTLLRHFKSILTPHGSRTGEILFEGKPIEQVDRRRQAEAIGFVLQNPDSQIVTDKVWHELAFGLESLGYPNQAIRLRVAEMASFFGIDSWFYQNVAELSGGQKQLLNLASIMAMEPTVLLLDEPTSQLDPIAAGEFLNTLKKINQEIGTTIILTEHRLAEALPMADRLIVLEEGGVFADGAPSEVGRLLQGKKHELFWAMPAPMRIFAEVGGPFPCPVTVGEGRRWLNQILEDAPLESNPVEDGKKVDKAYKAPISLQLNQVWFGYEKNSPDIVRGADLTISEGEIFALLGPNGSGKSTILSLAAGINRPYRGKVLLQGEDLAKKKEKNQGSVCLLAQDPQTLFVQNRLDKDLEEMLSNRGFYEEEIRKQVANVCDKMELSHCLSSHPYDLSGGEQQRAALAKVFLARPQILLLDEPTKGMDAFFKEKFASMLKELAAEGATIFLVSHDIEFCASHAHRCGLFFDGRVISQGPPREFFGGNSFYTTGANRMSRHRFYGAITVQDVIWRCNESRRAKE